MQRSYTETKMFDTTADHTFDLDIDVGLAVCEASTVSMLEALKA